MKPTLNRSPNRSPFRSLERSSDRGLIRQFRLVAAFAALSFVAGVGCASKPVSKSILSATHGSVINGTFVPQAEAKLTPPSPITNIYAVGDAVYAYTKSNTVYGLSQGLDIRFIKQIVPAVEALRPPVEVANQVIFPSTIGMLVKTKEGEDIKTIRLIHPLTSDVHVDQRGLLLAGIATETGGRVAVFDPNKTYRPADQETLIGNVRSAPVALQGIVFAATDQGRVFAIATENRAAWPIAGMSFDTHKPIEADLVIDDYALYVASTDLKLYALDRSTGKIKWRYAAEVPLQDAPFVTKDRVYQVLPERGLAAINKLDGKLYREPLWVADGVTKVVAVDDKYVYGAQGSKRIVAIGINDGEIKFSADGKFDFVTSGSDGIFAASTDGRVVKLKRGPYTGEPMTAAAK